MGLLKTFEGILTEDTLKDNPRMKGLGQREKAMCGHLIKAYKTKHEAAIGLSKVQFADFVFAFVENTERANKNLDEHILRESNKGKFRIRASMPADALEGHENDLQGLGWGSGYGREGVFYDAPLAYVLETKTTNKDTGADKWEVVSVVAFRPDFNKKIFFIDQLQSGGPTSKHFLSDQGRVNLKKLRGSYNVLYDTVKEFAGRELVDRMGLGAIGLIRSEHVPHPDVKSRVRDGKKILYDLVSENRKHADRVPWLPGGGSREYTYDILKMRS